MKRNFTHEDFERFLKQSADQLRLRPTDNVWQKIEQRMYRRRRIVFLTSALFFVTASVFGYFLINSAETIQPPIGLTNTTQKTQRPGTPPVLDGVDAPRPEAAATGQPPAAQQPLSRFTPLRRAAMPVAATAAGMAETPTATTAEEATAADFTPTIVDTYTPETESGATGPATPAAQEAPKQNIWTIESVVNAYQRKLRRRRAELQLFFTPTISYRKLSENKSYLRAVPQNSITFNNSALYDVNNVVTHKPDLGLELGFALKYPITRNVRFRSGLQFNMNRYDIKAINYRPEVATIALNNGSRVDSLNTITRYRNSSGVRSDWLQNMYFQVSAPVGVEVKLRGDDKVQFGLATTIQPTYIIGDKAYLISSDYKNYSQVPGLIRRWNVNTNLETFVSYSTGHLKWQVGPQVRYQLLSSFVNVYPVKENLFDFGLKVGVSLNR